MKKTADTTQGYILVLTLMVVSILVLLVTQISHRGMVHVHFDQTMTEQEKAKELALGGIQLAISQLAFKETETGKQEKQKNTKEEFYKKVIPSLNRWQEFKLKEDIDGVEGTVQFAINCEQGKIDLNQIFDFNEKKFKGEGQQENDKKKLIQDFFGSIKKFTGEKDLFSSFEKFLKQRNFKLNDATELLTIPEFQKAFLIDVFYNPPTKEAKEKRPLYLTDLFTVFSGKDTVQPWFLSDSVSGALGLKRAQVGDAEKRERQLVEVLKEKDLKDKAQIWDKQLQPFYGKDFKSLPKEIQNIIDPAFEPTVFSVLSYGIIGAITQKIFAIIEKPSSSQEDEAPFVVKKLYWL